MNWNKEANILFIEGPAGVGFADGDSEDISDKDFADQTLKALESFYIKFPELKDQDLYLTGEQYTGVTIPTLAKLIVDRNINPDLPSW
jgi:serine carboxypeptidase-like clade 2